MNKILCPSGLWVSEDECETCGQCRPNERVGLVRKDKELMPASVINVNDIPTEANGMKYKDASKLADKFMKEHPCDEEWEMVRALQDFYEYVMCLADGSIKTD